MEGNAGTARKEDIVEKFIVECVDVRVCDMWIGWKIYFHMWTSVFWISTASEIRSVRVNQALQKCHIGSVSFKKRLPTCLEASVGTSAAL